MSVKHNLWSGKNGKVIFNESEKSQVLHIFVNSDILLYSVSMLLFSEQFTYFSYLCIFSLYVMFGKNIYGYL